jgi:hypothetical protein
MPVIKLLYMPLQDYPSAELEPRCLSKEEIENPYTVLTDFFSYGHIPEIRNQLWELLKLTVSSSYHKQSRREKADLVYFYDRLSKLIEAIYLIHCRAASDQTNE